MPLWSPSPVPKRRAPKPTVPGTLQEPHSKHFHLAPRDADWVSLLFSPAPFLRPNTLCVLHSQFREHLSCSLNLPICFLLGMRIRKPKQQLLVRRRNHVVTRVPRHNGRLALVLQHVRRLQHLVMARDRQRVPDEQVLPRAAHHIASVGRKAAFAAAIVEAAFHLACRHPSRAHAWLSEVCLEAPVKGIEEEVPAGPGPEEDVLAVVGELEDREASEGGVRLGGTQ